MSNSAPKARLSACFCLLCFLYYSLLVSPHVTNTADSMSLEDSKATSKREDIKVHSLFEKWICAVVMVRLPYCGDDMSTPLPHRWGLWIGI